MAQERRDAGESVTILWLDLTSLGLDPLLTGLSRTPVLAALRAGRAGAATSEPLPGVSPRGAPSLCRSLSDAGRNRG